MEALLLEVTHDIFPVNYTSFYLVFILLGLLAVFDTVDSPHPTPFTTPHKYSVVVLIDIFVFFTNPVTNLVYFTSPPAWIATQAVFHLVLQVLFSLSSNPQCQSD